MKKRYIILAGLLALALTAAGCGKKEDNQAAQQPTVTPAATAAPTAVPGNMVDMEVSEETNVMGEKTATASKVTLVNRTGSEIGAIYIRQHPSEDEDDEEWGSDLVEGQFVLKNGDQAVYYFQKPSSGAITYDIRITYTEEDKNECFFRELPLAAIKQITLRMDGTGEDSIPFATYMTASGTKEQSTLNEVKKRLGLTVDEDDKDSSDEDESPEPTEAPEPTRAPEPTQTPDSGSGDNGDSSSDDNIHTAEQYIGQSMDALIGTIGSPQYDEYEDEPDTGKTGYHYYSNFTVSTTIDENGNEIVTGIW